MMIFFHFEKRIGWKFRFPDAARYSPVRQLFKGNVRQKQQALLLSIYRVHGLRCPLHHHYSLPYDRGHTIMDEFTMCEPCSREYLDPTDRRFRAEPICCQACGPVYTLYRGKEPLNSENPIRDAAKALDDGNLVAMKGIGGTHLCARTTDDGADTGAGSDGGAPEGGSDASGTDAGDAPDGGSEGSSSGGGGDSGSGEVWA